MELFFDRGTIIVASGGPPSWTSGCLPDSFLWDRRIGRWRAPAFALPSIRRWFQEHGPPFTYRSPRPADFLPAPVPPESLPPLRPYQDEAIQAWIAARRRGVVALPTGSGKTRVAIHAMLLLGKPALVVVPTRQLLHQWRAAIIQFYSGPVGVYGDGEHDLQPFTVATYESAHRHVDQVGDHFDLIVVDEAHHLASREVSEVAQMATAPFRLGLSATFLEAHRSGGLHERLLGPLCFSLPVARLTGKYLAAFDFKVLPVRLTPQERSAYESQRTTFLLSFRPFMEVHPDAAWLDFVRAAARSPQGREALRALRKSREILSLSRAKIAALDTLLDLHHAEPKLIFTGDNRAAYEISRRFLLPAITCDIERPEREEILRRFKEGKYHALVSAKVLNEGFDVPAASIAIVAGGSPSPVEHAQRIGRVLRPREGKKALVYELVVPGTSDWRTSERRSRSSVLDPASSP
jgi:superfamily II DNA or RNA helicase